LRPATERGVVLVRALRNDRIVAAAGLLGVAVLAWLYLLGIEATRMGAVTDSMDSMDTMAGPKGAVGDSGMAAGPWQIASLALTFLMWSVMMVAMMLPSAMPAMVLYGSILRKNRDAGSVLPSIWIFAAGYVSVWTGFALAAAILQVALDSSGLLTPMMSSASPWLTGGLLVLAGIYQWLPIKDACLHKCREPMTFFLMRWRAGAAGAFRMGAEHGLYCVGCCWAIMLLLFAAGVMNLLWVALIAAYVLVEKLFPKGRFIGRLAGAVMATVGVAMIIMGVGA
jgi:predicted metal-binding membrane protein